jgi:hypothetical protein
MQRCGGGSGGGGGDGVVVVVLVSVVVVVVAVAVVVQLLMTYLAVALEHASNVSFRTTRNINAVNLDDL